MQIDIGLLVLNAGMGTRDPLGVCDPKLSQNLLDANVYHVAILLKLMLPQLKTRDKMLLDGCRRTARSGVIITSSIAPKASTAKGTQYSASKIFCNFLGEAVNYELKKEDSRVDFTVLMPGPVYTNMTAKMPKTGSCIWATPKKCVYKTLVDLGREEGTYGAVSHEIIGYLCGVILQHWLSLGFRSQ